MSDLAIILIDSRKGVLEQTLRHIFISYIMGIKQIIFAINKMDLIKFSENKFLLLKENLLMKLKVLDFTYIKFIPVSALKGDNITKKSTNMKWYKGLNLLSELLKSKIIKSEKNLRIPIQSVNRSSSDFRGYMGRIFSGELKVNSKIKVIPSELSSKISEIFIGDKKVKKAISPSSITFTLKDDVSISRGDLIVGYKEELESSDQFKAEIIWLDKNPLIPGRKYLMKSNLYQGSITLFKPKYLIDMKSYSRSPANNLKINQIGGCDIALNKSIYFDPYKKNRYTGSFIIVDRDNYNTIGGGIILHPLRRGTNITTQNFTINKKSRSLQKKQKPFVIWLTGISGSGKSSIANLLEKKLFEQNLHTYVIDGDNVRQGLNKNLGFTDVDRVENIRRITEVTKLMVDAGLIVIVSCISPFKIDRKSAKKLFKKDEFIEVYVECSLKVAERRDVKGLYKKARLGKLKNFSGIDSIYEKPENADIVLNTENSKPQKSTNTLFDFIKKNKLYKN